MLEPSLLAFLFEVATQVPAPPEAPVPQDKGPFWTRGPVALIASALTLMASGVLVLPRWVYNVSEARNVDLTAENKRLTEKIEWMAVNYPILLRDVARTGK